MHAGIFINDCARTFQYVIKCAQGSVVPSGITVVEVNAVYVRLPISVIPHLPDLDVHQQCRLPSDGSNHDQKAHQKPHRQASQGRWWFIRQWCWWRCFPRSVCWLCISLRHFAVCSAASSCTLLLVLASSTFACTFVAPLTLLEGQGCDGHRARHPQGFLVQCAIPDQGMLLRGCCTHVLGGLQVHLFAGEPLRVPEAVDLSHGCSSKIVLCK